MSDHVTEYSILRKSDEETLAWLTAEQYDEVRTLRLLAPKFIWEGTAPVNLNKFSLGPNNLAGAVQQVIVIPGIDTKFALLSVYVTHHDLKKPEVNMMAVKIRVM
ncbi:putative polyprotein [Kosakonia phage Kc283]|uniref:Polyprotein n=1 Tax=Kosakonia phage Kc283 TaxID=2863195 RepID=A0AAE7WFB6_9CAUD|nr:putative polyprotein [Kosakonia phage Kc283]QYN79813.1 putative polyprotein [Kosakonia phage Kc283]